MKKHFSSADLMSAFNGMSNRLDSLFLRFDAQEERIAKLESLVAQPKAEKPARPRTVATAKQSGKPATKPASKPATKPASKPATQARPKAEKPALKLKNPDAAASDAQIDLVVRVLRSGMHAKGYTKRKLSSAEWQALAKKARKAYPTMGEASAFISAGIHLLKRSR